MTLTEFLAARLSEDEVVARAAIDKGASGQWHVRHDGCDEDCPDPCPQVGNCHAEYCWHCVVEGDDILIYDEGGHDPAQADHITRHDPARTLRRIDAKRAILAMLADDEAALDRGYTELTRGSQLALLGVVGHLAAVYSDHPDYGLVRTR